LPEILLEENNVSLSNRKYITIDLDIHEAISNTYRATEIISYYKSRIEY